MAHKSTPRRSPFPEIPISSASSITHVDHGCIPTFKLLNIFAPKKASLQSETYRIGNQVTPALVTVEDLRSSLRLLGAFHQLREEVRCSQRQRDRALEASTQVVDAWEVYLARAVYRFQLWVKKVVNDIRPEGVGFSSIEIPPLDVVLVWHTYLLNPRVYYEDCVRIHKGLLSRGSFPLHKIAETIDPSTFKSNAPEPAQANHFSIRTGQPFELALQCLSSDTAALRCPSCGTRIQAPWIAADFQGFAQDDFFIVCAKCNRVADWPALQIAKFKRDMELIYRYPEGYTVAGMLLDPKTGVPATLCPLSKTKTNTPRSSRIDLQQDVSTEPERPASPASSNRTVTSLPAVDRPHFKEFNQNILNAWIPDNNSISSSTKHAKCKMDGRSIEDMIKMGFTGHVAPYYDDKPEYMPIGLKRILSHYRTPGSFSIDLVKATQRQEKFTSKMVEIGWVSTTGRHQHLLDQELNRSVNQYHAFLDVMAVNPKAFLVPTLSIDLAWHTHQLLCNSYRRDTLALLGTIVDHDDSVEEVHIASSFDNTAKLWKDRYGLQYSACEHPPKKQKQDEKENDKPKGFRRFLAILGLNISKSNKPKKAQHHDLGTSKSSTICDNNKNGHSTGSLKGSQRPDCADCTCPRPDLVLPDSGADETYPSDHPSVRVFNHSKIDETRKVRQMNWVERMMGGVNLVLADNSGGVAAVCKDMRDSEHMHHEKVAFAQKPKNALDRTNLCGGEIGPFVAGVDEAAMCRAGNHKPRDTPRKPVRPKIQMIPSSGSRVFQGTMGNCGGGIVG